MCAFILFISAGPGCRGGVAVTGCPHCLAHNLMGRNAWELCREKHLPERFREGKSIHSLAMLCVRWATFNKVFKFSK